jgi:hypothetical protein
MSQPYSYLTIEEKNDYTFKSKNLNTIISQLTTMKDGKCISCGSLSISMTNDGNKTGICAGCNKILWKYE